MRTWIVAPIAILGLSSSLARANPYLTPFRNQPILIQKADTATATTSATRTITLKPTGSGNLIVIGSINASTSTAISSITDNVGNTYVSAAAKCTDSAGATGEIWYAKNSKAGATTVTITYSASTSNQSWAFEVSRMDLTTPVDVVGQMSNATSASPKPGPSLTTTKAHDFVVSLCAPGGNVTAVASPFVGVTFVNGNGAGYLNTVKIGTYQASWTTTGGTNYCATSVAFKSQL